MTRIRGGKGRCPVLKELKFESEDVKPPLDLEKQSILGHQL